MNNHDFLVAQALGAIAQTGKVVEVNHDIAENMGAYPDPALAAINADGILEAGV